MPHAFADIAFTPAVRAAQTRAGSRDSYARGFEARDGVSNSALGEAEREFIAAQRSFYIASVSETGWPYVQHRGGPRGFLKTPDAHTLAFADFAGNRQFISVGNAAGNDRVALILVDYAHRRRLKLLGHLSVRDLDPQDSVHASVLDTGYRASVQRVMTIRIAAFDWNCPQHIPVRFDAEDVQRTLDERDARIAALEAELALLRGVAQPAPGAGSG